MAKDTLYLDSVNFIIENTGIELDARKLGSIRKAVSEGLRKKPYEGWHFSYEDNGVKKKIWVAFTQNQRDIFARQNPEITMIEVQAEAAKKAKQYQTQWYQENRLNKNGWVDLEAEAKTTIDLEVRLLHDTKQNRRFIVQVKGSGRLHIDHEERFSSLEKAREYRDDLLDGRSNSNVVYPMEHLYYLWFERRFATYYNRSEVLRLNSEKYSNELERKNAKIREIIKILTIQYRANTYLYLPQNLSFMGFLILIKPYPTKGESGGVKGQKGSYRHNLYQALGVENLKIPTDPGSLDSYVIDWLKVIGERGVLIGHDDWDYHGEGESKVHKSAWAVVRVTALSDLGTNAKSQGSYIFPGAVGLYDKIRHHRTGWLARIKEKAKASETFKEFAATDLDRFFRLKYDKDLNKILTFLVGCFGFRPDELAKFQAAYQRHLDKWCLINSFSNQRYSTTDDIDPSVDFHFKYKYEHFEACKDALLIGVGKDREPGRGGKRKFDPKFDVLMPPYMVLLIRALKTGIENSNHALKLKLGQIDEKWIKFTTLPNGNQDSHFEKFYPRSLKTTGLRFTVYSDNPDSRERFDSTTGIFLAMKRAGHKEITMTIQHYATNREEEGPLDGAYCVDGVPFRFCVLPFQNSDGDWYDLLSSQYVYDAILLHYLFEVLEFYFPTKDYQYAWRAELYVIWQRYQKLLKKNPRRILKINSPKGREFYKTLYEDFVTHIANLTPERKVKALSLTRMDQLKVVLDEATEERDLIETVRTLRTRYMEVEDRINDLANREGKDPDELKKSILKRAGISPGSNKRLLVDAGKTLEAQSDKDEPEEGDGQVKLLRDGG